MEHDPRPDPAVLRAAARAHLRRAADAYGNDLPLAVPAPAATRKPRQDLRQDLSQSPSQEPGLKPGQEPAPAASLDPTEALQLLREEALPCTKCKLCEGRTQVVFGDGNPKARVMFIGEAPGQTEDQQGLPFVGRAGQLLTRIIEGAMGLQRADVYIANVNKCRPPGNRDPEPEEVAACMPYLLRQIEIIAPEVLVTLGKVATWNLLGVAEPMKNLRSRPLLHRQIPVVVTWHPAYLLRNPAAKADTWEDIKRVNRLLGLPEVPTRSPLGES